MVDTPKDLNIHLCTLFDIGFFSQGLALIESVSSNTEANVSWTVLALDIMTVKKLNSLNLPNVEIIPFDCFEDEELINLVGTRSWREICWTSAACILNFCLSNYHEFDYIGYVDADCFFFGDIAAMVLKIPSDKDFAIHEHKYSADRMEWASKSGRFNVGVVVGKPSIQFIQCISGWRQDVIERCDVDADSGRCGDQTYLNSWPERFESLYVFTDLGVGVAPWNLNNYKVSKLGCEVRVDSEIVYFFHFHGLEVKTLFSRMYFFVPAGGYQLNSIPLKEIYVPYLGNISRVSRNSKIKFRPFKTKSDLKWFARNLISSRVHFRLLMSSVYKR